MLEEELLWPVGEERKCRGAERKKKQEEEEKEEEENRERGIREAKSRETERRGRR